MFECVYDFVRKAIFINGVEDYVRIVLLVNTFLVATHTDLGSDR